MELSQTSIGLLLLLGIPVGILLNALYALTDLGTKKRSLGKRLLIQIKDFLFATLAGLSAILLVYYVNDGEFRYWVLFGIVIGYTLSSVTIGKCVLAARNAVLSVILRFITTPLLFLWRITLARPCAKARQARLEKATERQAQKTMQLASNGFENDSEAKE